MVIERKDGNLIWKRRVTRHISVFLMPKLDRTQIPTLARAGFEGSRSREKMEAKLTCGDDTSDYVV